MYGEGRESPCMVRSNMSRGSRTMPESAYIWWGSVQKWISLNRSRKWSHRDTFSHPLCEQTDTHNWKNYLAATSLVGGKIRHVCSRNWENLAMISATRGQTPLKILQHDPYMRIKSYRTSYRSGTVVSCRAGISVIYTICPQTKWREGNVFTHFCPSTGG